MNGPTLDVATGIGGVTGRVRFQQRDMPASAWRSLPLRAKSGNVDEGIRAGRECSVFVIPEVAPVTAIAIELAADA